MQHTALHQQLKEARFLQPDYADGTKLNILGILRKWEKYNAWAAYPFPPYTDPVLDISDRQLI